MDNYEVQEVTTLALSVPDQAKQIAVIKTAEDYIRAGEVLLTIKDIRKKIEATFKPIKQKMDAAKKEVLDQEKAADKPLADAEAWIKPRISAYLAEQEKIRQAEETRLREIARKEEEDRKLAEAIAAPPEEQAAILDEPVQVAPIIVPKAVPKVQGISTQKRWTFRITNPALVPREYWSIDEKKIGAVVTGLKDQARIPGVEIYSEDVVSAGRRGGA
jgi:hypothetical protein